MNNLDKQYTDLLQDILDNGITKKDRTGTGTISVFGRQIKHKMAEGFPLLTTKKMYFKGIATELIWFLKGDTNIKYLVDNDCHIWDGDAYKNYEKSYEKALKENTPQRLLELYPDWKPHKLSMEDFITTIKSNDRYDEFVKRWGDLGPIYGKQWRDWHVVDLDADPKTNSDSYHMHYDQIKSLINDLKNNPDSRRLMVSAWNVAEIDKAVLPPCHYGFQCWTRELTWKERFDMCDNKEKGHISPCTEIIINLQMDQWNVSKRAISLMWNQRSVDTFLGLPFNIASYGLLLEIIAKEVNMVPDELIGNLGDTHIYLNHIEQAKEQIGRELTLKERYDLLYEKQDETWRNYYDFEKFELDYSTDSLRLDGPHRTREPFPLPKLNITEYEDQTFSIFGKLYWDNFQIQGYQSHPSIKAKLSN